MSGYTNYGNRMVYALMVFALIFVSAASAWIGYGHGKNQGPGAILERVCNSPARYEAMSQGADCYRTSPHR